MSRSLSNVIRSFGRQACIPVLAAMLVAANGKGAAIAQDDTKSAGIRMMLKVQIPAEGGNRAIKDGTMMPIFEEVIKRAKPEASYFTQEDGMRTVYLVYMVQDPAEFAALHEPLMQGMDALVFDMTVTTWEELQHGFAEIGEK